jgi:hypothetical protein
VIKEDLRGRTVKGRTFPEDTDNWTNEHWKYLTGAVKHALGLSPGDEEHPVLMEALRRNLG